MAPEIDRTVLENAKRYVEARRQNKVLFEAAWLFGSYAKNQPSEDSDIDIAVIMGEVEGRFFKELELMGYRRKIDLRIEPRILTPEEINSPFGEEIVKTGVKIA